MKQKASLNFQNNNEALYPCLSVKKILRISIVTFCILSCLFIFPKTIFAQLEVEGGFGNTTPGTGDAATSGGKTPKTITPLVPNNLGSTQTPVSFPSLQELGRTAMTAARPAIEGAYGVGRATYNTVVPALTTAYKEFGRIAATTQTTPVAPLEPIRQPAPPAAPARLEPIRQPAVPVTIEPVRPLEPPRQPATPVMAATLIQPVPSNSFARISTNYNMSSLPARVSNLNNTFKPVRIDVPSGIALQNLKYENLQMAKLQIKPLPAIKPIANLNANPLQSQSFAKITTPKIMPMDKLMVKPIGLSPITILKPIANTLRPIQTPGFAKLTMPKLTPIDKLISKPVGITPIAMQKPIANLKPIQTPMPIKSIAYTVKPIGMNPIIMPQLKPTMSALKPLQTPGFAKSTMPNFMPVDKLMVKPIGLSPITMPKPIANTLKPIQTPSFAKLTMPAIAPIDKIIVKPIGMDKPLSIQKPIAVNIKPMPTPKFAHVDILSLNYMGKAFNFEIPKYLNITTPKIASVKIAPIRLPEVEIPKYAMANITITQTKHYSVNRQAVEKTIKLYDAKVIRDASRINSMISPGNNLQKYFNSRNEITVDLTKFIQNAPLQRKEIINQAQFYSNGAEVKKLQALDAWRNEYDKFFALSANISNVVKETGHVDAASLEYLESAKENLDALTRNITDMGIDKTAIQQAIKSPNETVINPLMKDRAPMPVALESLSLRGLPVIEIAPKINILGGLTNGVNNLFSSAVHAKEQ